MSPVKTEYLGRSLPKYIINYIISFSIYHCFSLYILFCGQTLNVWILYLPFLKEKPSKVSILFVGTVYIVFCPKISILNGYNSL